MKKAQINLAQKSQKDSSDMLQLSDDVESVQNV